MEEPKDCDKCGSSAIIHFIDGKCRVGCMSGVGVCDAPPVHRSSKGAAVKAWNTRVKEKGVDHG